MLINRPPAETMPRAQTHQAHYHRWYLLTAQATDSHTQTLLYIGTAVQAGRPGISYIQHILHSVLGPIDLKIRSYPFATISDTWDILIYYVCSSFVWLLICVSVIIQLMAATKQ